MGVKFLYKSATASFAVAVKLSDEDRSRTLDAEREVIRVSLKKNEAPAFLAKCLANLAEGSLGKAAMASPEVEWCKAQGIEYCVHYDRPLTRGMAFRLELPDKYAPLFKLAFGGR